MRVIRDLGYVQKKRRNGRWAAIIGFAMLGSSFWVATSSASNPNGVLVAYALMIVGFIAFNYGMQHIAKWGRNPRNDQILDNLLKSLGDKYVLFHYANPGKRVIEHLLFHPGGAEVLTVRELPGGVAYQKDRWRKKGGGLGRLVGMGGPQLGNPSLDAQSDLDGLNAFLAANQVAIETDAAIVFVNPAAVLDVTEPDFPVMNGEGLPEFLRTLPADGDFRPAERQRIIELLSANAIQLEEAQPVAPKRRPVKRRSVKGGVAEGN